MPFEEKHGLSRHNIFCTGMSNGGEMCYQLAAQRPRLFAAAPVSGLMLDWLYKADRSTVPSLAFRNTRHLEDRTSGMGRSDSAKIQKAVGSCPCR